MARDYEYELQISADTDDLERAERVIEDIDEALEGTETTARDALAVLGALADDLEAELTGTASAADALKVALGDAFDGDSARVEKFVGDLQALGVSFDEIEANAKEFADVIERVDGIKLDAVNSGLTNVEGSLGRVRSNADQSRSVLANLAGNAAQDLGELGGVVGSLGVGIGQLAEYAVDGNISLSNLAKVAGPMLGVAGALALVNRAAAENQREAQAAAERINTFREAIEELGPSAEAAAAGLADLLDIPAAPETQNILETLGDAFTGLGEDIISFFEISNDNPVDLAYVLSTIGVTMEQVSAAMAGGEEAWNTFLEAVVNDYRLEGWSDRVKTQLTDAYDAYTGGVTKAEGRSQFFATSLEGLQTAMQGVNRESTQVGEAWEVLVNDLADGSLSTEGSVRAWNLLRTELGLSNEQIARMLNEKLDEKLENEADATDKATDAWEAYQEALGEAGQEINRIVAELPDLGDEFASTLDAGDATVDFQGAKASVDDAIEELQEYIDEHGEIDWSALLDMSQLDPSEIDADMVSVVTGVRDALQSGIVSAFELGGVQSAQHFLDTFLPRLMEDGGLTEQEALQLLGLPEDGTIDAVLAPIIDADKAERARRILEALAGAGVSDPRIARIQVLLESDQIDGEMAYIISQIVAHEAGIAVYPVVDETTTAEEIAAAQAYVDGMPLTLTGEMDTLPIKQSVDELAGGKYTVPIKAEAETDTAVGDLETAAEPRTAQFEIDLWNIIVQNALLNKVAEPRTAKITAEAHTFAAENALDAAAEDRTSTIFADAILRSFPTEREIINHITNGKGYIPIPIDTRLRYVARIDGSRVPG